MKELKEADFQAAVEENSKVTVVDFWAPWCGYCVRMMPIFEALDAKMSDKVDFAKVNTDEEPGLAQKYNVEVLPTFLIVKDGQVVDRKIGFIPEEELQTAIEKAL